ncbi:MAG: hypothetical protein ACRC7N_14575 [Clostridium sp.]
MEMMTYAFKYRGKRVNVIFSDNRKKEFSLTWNGALCIFVNSKNKNKIHRFLKRIRRKD